MAKLQERIAVLGIILSFSLVLVLFIVMFARYIVRWVGDDTVLVEGSITCNCTHCVCDGTGRRLSDEEAKEIRRRWVTEQSDVVLYCAGEKDQYLICRNIMLPGFDAMLRAGVCESVWKVYTCELEDAR